MNSYKEAEMLYLLNKGVTVNANKYIGVVSGFHFAWDDNDSNYIIVSVIKNINGLNNGINYRLNGDVIVVRNHTGLGYDFIHQSDISKYGLKTKSNERNT